MISAVLNIRVEPLKIRILLLF